MSEKPTRVEVGSVWRNPYCNARFNPQTVTALDVYDGDGVPAPGVVFRCGNSETRHWPADKVLSQFEYLGGGSGTSSPVPAEGVIWQGSIDGETWCEMAQGPACDCPRSRQYVDGTLVAEFYRDVQGKFQMLKSYPFPTGKPAAPPPAEPLPPKYTTTGIGGTHAREDCTWEGKPLTALQRIQAKKKPEPWVPSCDELHWLKDA